MPEADKGGTLRLDDLDRAILAALKDDARMPNSELAERVGVAPSTAHVRLRSLVDRGVITGFVTSVDQRALGLGLQALIGVTLRPGARQSSIAAFANEIRLLPQVVQLFFLGGHDDFIVHVAVPDASAMRSFVVDYLSGNQGVASTRTSLIFDYHRNSVISPFQ